MVYIKYFYIINTYIYYNNNIIKKEIIVQYYLFNLLQIFTISMIKFLSLRGVVLKEEFFLYCWLIITEIIL